MERADVVEVDQPIVVQYVNRMLAEAVFNRHASTLCLHVIEGQPDSPVEVYRHRRVEILFCIDSVWGEFDSIRWNFYSPIVNRLRIMAGLDYWKIDKQQTGELRLSRDDQSFLCTLSIQKPGQYEEVTIDIAPVG